MTNEEIVERVMELAAEGTEEALKEMRELIEAHPAELRIGTIKAGGNINIGRNVVVVNGRRVA